MIKAERIQFGNMRRSHFATLIETKQDSFIICWENTDYITYGLSQAKKEGLSIDELSWGNHCDNCCQNKWTELSNKNRKAVLKLWNSIAT